MGEPISLTGDLLFIEHVLRGADWERHVVTNQSQGVHGTGLQTGADYRLVLHLTEVVSIDVSSGNSSTVQSEVMLQVIGQGPANDSVLHVVSQFTIDDGGILNIHFEKFTQTCR